MSDKIKIRHITGGSTGDKLEGCYFVPTGDGTYAFYDKKEGNKDEPLKTGITAESSFEFELPDHPDLPWKIYVESISHKHADGEWFAGLQKISPPGTGDDAGSGTFQAQAGGSIAPEDAAASATA